MTEVDAAVRNAGHGRLEAVAAVVLETDGSLSVFARTGEKELTGLHPHRDHRIEGWRTRWPVQVGGEGSISSHRD